VQNRAAEVKLRAERQAGKLLGDMMLRGGDRRSKSRHDRLKLDDLGLTANQSKRWQLQARVPEEIFREHVRQTRNEGKELTSAGLMRLAKRLKNNRVSLDAHSHKQNGHTTKGSHVEVRDYLTPRPSLVGDNPSLAGEAADIVEELCNHHQVLDGILSCAYRGGLASLSPAELRMTRYLMSEIGDLLAHLARSQQSASGRTCRNNGRVAG
jgi:hypothetical protein